MKRILVPTDFSQPAQWAGEIAADIARKSGAEVLLLHIVEHPVKQSFSAEGEIDGIDDPEEKLFIFKLIERSKALLNEMAASIRQADVLVKPILRLGNPYHGIQTIITDFNVDLVVMGSSSTHFSEISVGANTEKVIRLSKCPVLAIHQPKKKMDFSTIVYATSLNETEKDFSFVVKMIQELYDSKVHLVRINTPQNFHPDKDVKLRMEKFANKVGLQNFTLNIFNDLSEEDGIIHFAESVGADLISMATHGRTGLAHMMLGSITEDVVKHTKKPVLTFATKEE
jgi:nucleotide-binding universal stress UspA family protein